jgi:hypothetical protein
MIFKMLAVQRTWQQDPVGPKPRQIFITQSRRLATKVEEYFTKEMSSPGAGAYNSEGPHMIENVVEPEADMVNQEDNKRWRSDLPERFSELQVEHFPLFITYDRVRMPSSSMRSDLTIPRAALHNAPE